MPTYCFSSWVSMHAILESSSFKNLAEVQRNRRTFAVEDTLISIDTFVSKHVKLMQIYLFRLFFKFCILFKDFPALSPLYLPPFCSYDNCPIEAIKLSTVWTALALALLLLLLLLLFSLPLGVYYFFFATSSGACLVYVFQRKQMCNNTNSRSRSSFQLQLEAAVKRLRCNYE